MREVDDAPMSTQPGGRAPLVAAAIVGAAVLVVLVPRADHVLTLMSVLTVALLAAEVTVRVGERVALVTHQRATASPMRRPRAF